VKLLQCTQSLRCSVGYLRKELEFSVPLIIWMQQEISMTTSCSAQPMDDTVWTSLKKVISESSGFQSWMQDRNLDAIGADLDRLVHRYLRETLETLAY
jgi:hypothetical protein